MSAPAPISLADLVGELQLLDATSTAYLHRPTGRVVIVPDDAWDTEAAPVAEWERQMRAEIAEIHSSPDWLALPSQFDLHEYRVMERFAASLLPDEGGDVLLEAIRGRGAFRRFREAAARLGLEPLWVAARDRATADVASDWLVAHDIPFDDDVPPARATRPAPR